jgi:murein DD-endopeptidase MepM/ murein hydrolase activator NlpD
VDGTVAQVPFQLAGRGWFVKVRTDDGYLVYLYHLMNVRVSKGQRVAANTVIGQVYNNYSGSINHLHVQVTNSSGASIPLKLSGKRYGNLGGTNQWKGWDLQNNVLYQHTNYSGSYSNVVVSDPNLSNLVGNDTASSVRVNPGCVMTLYEHTNYWGHSESFKGNDPNLATHGFNDKASSLRLNC